MAEQTLDAAPACVAGADALTDSAEVSSTTAAVPSQPGADVTNAGAASSQTAAPDAAGEAEAAAASVGAVEASDPAPQPEAYIPSAPAESSEPVEQTQTQTQTQPTYDPSMPANQESYDPSAPADPSEQLAQPQAVGYDPSVPAEAAQQDSYDPSVPVQASEPPAETSDPSAPASAPVVETAVEPAYDPSVPAEQSYDPSVPAGQQPEDPPAPAAENGESGTEPAASGNEAPAADEAQPVAPVSADPAPFPTIPSLHVASTHALPKADAEYKAELPEGITDESPSVAANSGLIHRWRQDPSDETLPLDVFKWAIQHTEIDDARAWYEVVGKDNPTAAYPLLALINLELALNNFPQVEALFARALGAPTTLMSAASVDIWKAYLHYIRRQNPDGSSDSARATVIQAYEFALKECGLDRESGELWQEYIAYLEQNQSKNPWDKQQQNDTLRKTFQRAVTIPLNNVEALWKQYDAYESRQNKLLAKKFLADKSPAYMTARSALREMRTLTDVLPRPVLPPNPDFSEMDRRVVSYWRKYLEWEEGNPLASEDESVVAQRMGYALRKCMAEMRHFPELWHYAANYYLVKGDVDEGAKFLKAGVAACPKSFLLSFALAELEEERRNFAECHQVFEALIGTLNTEIDELKSRIPPAGDKEMDGQVEETDDEHQVRETVSALGLVWVMYLRFARRAEGLKAARLVFGKSRKSPHVHWLPFEASAMMEYHSNKDAAVAVRIFELGLKQFSEEAAFVIKYLQFLLSINDETNARALFERSALKIPADKSRNLWETWARFENMHGDLSAVRKLEQRWAEAFPKDTPLKRFASRYTYNGLDEIALRDLGLRQRGRPAPAFIPPPPPQVLAPPMPPFAPSGRASPLPRGSPAKRDRSPPRSPGRADKRPRPASPRRFAPPPPERSPAPPNPEPTLPKALEWFTSVLPPARSFDGAIFRADDIISLFSNISPNGTGLRRGPGPPPRQPEPFRRRY